MDPPPPQLPPLSGGNHRDTADFISLPPPSHPPYPEMIMAALECENSTENVELRGLSEREIAMYIHRCYTHLPHTHSSELTRHLKRLTNSGRLVLINNSYYLPCSLRSNSSSATGFNLGDRGVGLENESGLGKRGRGRPRKNCGPGLAQEVAHYVMVSYTEMGLKDGCRVLNTDMDMGVGKENGSGAGLKKGSGVGNWGVGSPREKIGPNLTQAQEGTVPDMVMGLESESSLVKRGVGRPRKKIDASVAQAQAHVHEAMAPGESIGGPHDEIGPNLTQVQEGMVPDMVMGLENGSTLVKRGVGRPRKKIDLSVAHDQAQAQVHEAMAPVESIKGPHDEIGLGLTGVQAQVDEAMVSGNGVDDVSMKRKRGRPRKGASPGLGQAKVQAQAQAQAQAQMHEAMSPGETIGVPHDEIAPGLNDNQAQVDEAMVSGNGVDDVSMKRKRGRPRKGTGPGLGHAQAQGQAQAQAQAQVEALRNESSLGICGRLRPRKEVRSGSIPDSDSDPDPDPVEARKYLLGKRGRPIGRPPKEWTHQQQQEMMNPTVLKPTLTQVLAANEELQTMLEEMQSKLKVAVGVIRPNLVIQSAPDVVAALQQLEQLSTMKPTTSAALDTGLTAQLQSTFAPNSLGSTSPKVVDFAAPPEIPLHFDINFPPDTLTAPLHNPYIGNQQPMSWIPSNDEQS